MGLVLNSGFPSMKQRGVLLLPPPPPGWDASPLQGYPQHICWYPFVHLGEEKHCESKVSCLRTQHNDPGQGSNLDHLIQSWTRLPWGHCASTLTFYCREFANSWANLWTREVICMAVESSSLLNNFYCHWICKHFLPGLLCYLCGWKNPCCSQRSWSEVFCHLRVCCWLVLCNIRK